MKRELVVLGLAIFLLIAGSTGPATAQPQYYNYNTDAQEGGNPFNNSLGVKAQLLFLPYDFSQPSAAPAGNISTVFFRVNSGYPISSWTYSQFTIKLGQTSITSLPAGNFYAGSLTTVYSRVSGTLTAAAGGWLAIALDTPFAYDPTQSLILDVGQCSAPGATGYSSCFTPVTGNRWAWSNDGCPFTYSGATNYILNFGITLAAAVPKPTVDTTAATSITTGGAILNGTVNANGSSTTATFDYGSDESYGGSVTATQSPVTGTTDTAVSASVSGVPPNTLVHYRVVGSNAGGTSRGDDMTFTTSGGPPAVTTTAATSVTATGARLNGTVNANDVYTDVVFKYGLDTSYGSLVTADQSPVEGTSEVAVGADVTGLNPYMVYHYRAVGANSVQTSNGGDMTFRTSAADQIPAMTEWGMILLALLLGAISVLYLGRRRPTAQQTAS